MIGIILFFAICLPLYIVCWRAAFRLLLYESGGRIALDDLLFAVFFAFPIATMMPFVLGYKFLEDRFDGGSLDTLALKLGGEDREHKIKRLEQEKADAQKHVAKLERELLENDA